MADIEMLHAIKSIHMRNLISNYFGVLLGSIYALILRLVFHFPLGDENGAGRFDFYDLFSIAFVWITPIIIGIIPMIFASNDQLKSISYRIWKPVLSVFIFFVITFIARIEDLICIIVISFPFLLGAMMGGLILGKVLEKYRKNKGIMLSIVMIPFIISPLEKSLPTPQNTFTIKTSKVINSNPNNIWNNIIRVRKIEQEEYTRGFFNYAGIPRPLWAELDKDELGATRIGHFEGGLIFKETVITWEKNKKIVFKIQVIPSSLRPTVFDEHILKGNHFKFLKASYELKQINENKTELILSSSYQLDTKINGYASFWGNEMLTDFQERLLDVIQNRCENVN
ncbi:MAG: hypothetical protein NVV82_15595 [Sporocytophaga sp.]|nr:hypothetical protein [Sporocytophaga sp.]